MSSLPAQKIVTKNNSVGLSWTLVLLFALAGIALRLMGLKFLSMDMRVFLFRWYDTLAADGFAALRNPFSDYTPPYLYLLFLATKTSGFLSKMTAIKLFSIGFDYLNAFWVYKILKLRFRQGIIPWIGASAFLLLPTVAFNSAYWGQCDSIYAFFLLACLFFLTKEQPLLAMIFLGISFAVKAQAFFLAPFVLLLILKKKIPWFYPGVIPLVYVLMMTPAALTGRPLLELLTIYAGQAGTYPELSAHAPNLYLLLPASLNAPGMVFLGMFITFVVAFVWIRSIAGKVTEFAPQTILLCALMSAALNVFFLPKMHERYFYLADILSFLMAFFFRRGWLLTIGYQLISGFAYPVFLLADIPWLTPPVAGYFIVLAIFINIALMGFLFSHPWNLAERRLGKLTISDLTPDTYTYDT